MCCAECGFAIRHTTSEHTVVVVLLSILPLDSLEGVWALECKGLDPSWRANGCGASAISRRKTTIRLVLRLGRTTLEFRIGGQSKIDHIAAFVRQDPIGTPMLIVLTQHQRGSAQLLQLCLLKKNLI